MSLGVIIVAAGRGDRLGSAVPKQFLDLGGRTVLQRSVAAFDAYPATRHLVVVVPESEVSTGIALTGATTRPCVVVGGGRRRQDSVRLGFAALPASCDLVLVHDAARPLVTPDLIDRVIDSARRVGASVPAVRARDTVKMSTESGEVERTVPRERVWLAQTPQGFAREVLATAVSLGADGDEATDEATLVERAGLPVGLVEGDPSNVKITTADDLAAVRARLASALRVGTGYDLHRLVEGRPLVLAGVVLPAGRGPHGHSDGDVVCHALIDALLGAAAEGDIGRHFPNTDPAWKDAPGLDLLARAVGLLGERGWRATNVDITVVLESPKVSPHVEAMRHALARVLGIGVDRVSVKGKTNEGVDAVGRGEAIAAQAVAAIEAVR